MSQIPADPSRSKAIAYVVLASAVIIGSALAANAVFFWVAAKVVKAAWN